MEHQEAVLEKINLVYDPELDKSVLEMDFIEEVKISGSTVTISMRLPTYWCSPNFAFIMAEDMRDRIMELPFISKVEINLKDHCASDEINRGVSEGKSFDEVFSNLASGDLNELRKTFRIKAFMSRQERLLRDLVNFGLTDKEILGLKIGELELHPGICERTVLDRYFALRSELGYCYNPNDLAFVKYTGEHIDTDEFSAYLLEARRTRMTMEFNSNYCRGLLETRYQTKFAEEGV